MADSGFSVTGVAEKVVASVVSAAIIALAGAVGMGWLRVEEWWWAAPMMYALVTGGLIFGILYGLLFQIRARSYWGIFSTLLACMFGILLYVDNKSQEQEAASIVPVLPGYDRLIPARSRQDGIEEGYEKAKEIWAASIAGVYFTHLRDEDREKITQVLLVDPNSALMETLIRIQPLRGEGMPGSVKEAVKICKDEKIEVRLSSHPVLNVVLFDPGKPHAWARVQEFIPYFPGEESVVYAIRKEEWDGLYNHIESSFKQAWKNGRDPNK